MAIHWSTPAPGAHCYSAARYVDMANGAVALLNGDSADQWDGNDPDAKIIAHSECPVLVPADAQELVHLLELHGRDEQAKAVYVAARQ